MRVLHLSTAFVVCASLLYLSSVRAAAPAAPTKTTLHFVSWKPDHPEVWDEAIRTFTEQHPHISIVREIAPHSSTAYHDLLTQKLKNRDTTVDVFFMDVIWVPEFAAAGWTRPIDDLLPATDQADFIPATLNVGRYEGRLFGVPSRIDAGLLYYRRDLLTKYGFSPPRSWAELADQATAIIAGEQAALPGLRGYSAQFKQYEGLVCNMLEFIGSHGGELLDPTGRRSALSTPATLRAMSFVRDRLMDHLTPRAALTYQEPESLALFAQGHAIFHRNWPYAWAIVNNPERSPVAGAVGLAPLPGTDVHGGTAALGGWLYGIHSVSPHVQEAWEFVAFLTARAQQKSFALAAGIAPSRRSLYDDRDVLASRPTLAQELTVLQTATARPRTPVYPAISHVLQRFFSRALAFPDRDLAAEAAAADQQINRLLDLARSAS